MTSQYRQAIAARSGEWSTGSTTSSGAEDRMTKNLEAENKELRARIEALEKKGGEGAQGGQGLPSRGESGMEEEWRMDMDFEEEVESRKKLDEQKRKLQKGLREIEKFSCFSKEVQEGLKSNLQQQLQEVKKKEEAATLRKRWIVAWRRWWNNSSLWVQIRRGLSSMPCARCSSRSSRLILLLRRCQAKEEEDEQEQDKATPASSLELDLPRVRSALDECGGAGKSGTAKDERKRPLSNSPSRLPMEEDAKLGDL